MRVMAIRRCPYCKAIIDEQDKYCNNCGTQLLFPEDEYVEEEIPGDKIIDDDEDDEEEEKEELVEEEPGEAALIEEEVEEEEEEEEETSAELEEPEEEEEPEEPAEEDRLKDEIEKDEEEKGLTGEEEEYATPGEVSSEEVDEEEEKEDEEIEERAEAVTEEPEEEEQEEEEEEIREQRLTPPTEEDAAKKYQVSIEEDELVFKTKDLDSLTGTVDEGKENLEEFLESYQGKSEEGKKQISDTGEELPPWLSGMKGGAPAGELEEEKEEEATGEVEAEKPPTRPEWTTDSGIGIPERVTQTQSGLPFSDTAAPAAGEEQEMAIGEGVEEEGEAGRETRRRPGFSLKFKAKLVDLVFITALWLISLWFASQVIGVSFFRLISGSPGPVLAFYLILLLLYFFLFLYFLGETLGDHFFSEED